jgi:hypothetical protein
MRTFSHSYYEYIQAFACRLQPMQTCALQQLFWLVTKIQFFGFFFAEELVLFIFFKISI